MIEYIKCCKCGETKHRDEFANDRTDSATGKQSTCRKCKAIYRRLPEVIERQNEYKRKSLEKCGYYDYIELKRLYREIIKRYDILVLVLNDIILKSNRNITHKVCGRCGIDKPIEQFDINHRRKDGSIRRKPVCHQCTAPQRRVKDIKRRQIARNIPEVFTSKDYNYVMKQFNNKCFNCGSTDNPHIDHHYPLSKGHALTIDNAVLLCRSCNMKKNNKQPEQFYTTEQLYILYYTYNKRLNKKSA